MRLICIGYQCCGDFHSLCSTLFIIFYFWDFMVCWIMGYLHNILSCSTYLQLRKIFKLWRCLSSLRKEAISLKMNYGKYEYILSHSQYIGIKTLYQCFKSPEDLSHGLKFQIFRNHQLIPIFFFKAKNQTYEKFICPKFYQYITEFEQTYSETIMEDSEACKDILGNEFMESKISFFCLTHGTSKPMERSIKTCLSNYMLMIHLEILLSVEQAYIILFHFVWPATSNEKSGIKLPFFCHIRDKVSSWYSISSQLIVFMFN
ncbi:hypothetical protein VP01_2676g3 [Puccinia sorghi]|uniref:Uncharacterized protein n=1 Tax=Puccinia sorghi TaxID=27349 RepID=A0A0L6V3V8_9BASI|nr:hypothetical protein VP01_2676g3 [Puccinia sorghi]